MGKLEKWCVEPLQAVWLLLACKLCSWWLSQQTLDTKGMDGSGSPAWCYFAVAMSSWLGSSSGEQVDVSHN